MTEIQKKFLKDLYELLNKYNAEIMWTCDESSDTFGIIDEKMILSIKGENDIEFKYANSIGIDNLESKIDKNK